MQMHASTHATMLRRQLTFKPKIKFPPTDVKSSMQADINRDGIEKSQFRFPRAHF